MPREKESSQGMVYSRTDRKRWITQFYDYNSITQKSSKKINALKMKRLKRNIYIENNGIPLKDLMTTIVQNKYDNNFISESQYESVKNTLKSIFKAELVNKNIEDIKAEELQKFINTYKDYSDPSIKKIIGQFR